MRCKIGEGDAKRKNMLMSWLKVADVNYYDRKYTK